MAGISKKSTKNSNVITTEASPTDTALQTELMSQIKQAQEAIDKARAKGGHATMDIF